MSDSMTLPLFPDLPDEPPRSSPPPSSQQSAPQSSPTRSTAPAPVAASARTPSQADSPSPTPDEGPTALHHASARLDALLTLLDAWAQRDWLRELDRAFAAFLAREAPDAAPLLILAAALASHQLGRGHVCLDLAATLDDTRFVLSLPPEGDAADAQPVLPSAFLDGLDLDRWRDALHHPLLVGTGAGATPLVLDGNRLYLRRYWQYERSVRDAIDQRLHAGTSLRQALPLDALRTTLDILFPPRDAATHAADWQKLACAVAAGNAFGIITGGPGTGKTTTVVKLLALLQTLALQRATDEANGGPAGAPANASRVIAPATGLRIRLAAPTGKAAARLNESIGAAVERLPLQGLAHAEAVRAAIPREVTTLHRLLGSRPDSRHFRHHARNPLSLDVLVIDEASMVDLEMMAAVLAALPANARLVLLGDKDQLASVEAGAVLGELCRHAREGRYTRETADWLATATGETIDASLLAQREEDDVRDPARQRDLSGEGRDARLALDQAVAMLRESYRFTAESGINRLAEAVNAGDVAATQSVWTHAYTDLCRTRLPADDDGPLRTLVIDGAPARFPGAPHGPRAPVGYRHYLEVVRDGRPGAHDEPTRFDDWARQVLTAHGQFQVLCGSRRGAYGIEGLNQRIAAMLHARGLIPAESGWYLGRPVLVTRNDYSLGLMNGDIGITLEKPIQAADAPHDAPGKWALRVAFMSSDGSRTIRWILPSRLQAVETVYAMTVHKSQGSEFTHAALILPERLNPILTRELVYTGITRARQWFTLASAGDDSVFDTAITRCVQRASGLLND